MWRISKSFTHLFIEIYVRNYQEGNFYKSSKGSIKVFKKIPKKMGATPT